MNVETETGLNIEDHEALRAFLVRSGRVGAGETMSFRNLAAGSASSSGKRVVRVELPMRRQAWVLKQIAKKPRTEADAQTDRFCDPARIEREALGLRHLSTLMPAATPILLFQNQKFHVLAMQAVPRPHESLEELLMHGAIEREMVRAFGKLLGTLHRESWRRRADLETIFADRALFEALRVEPYYEYSPTQVPAAAPFLGVLIEEMRATNLALTHGSYSPRSILIHNRQPVLLDHEAIHWGDPAFDVGLALAHFASAAHHLAKRRSELLEAALTFWKEYRTDVRTLSWSSGLEARCVRHALACFLAHGASRTPLDYLSRSEKTQQCALVVTLMENAPRTVETLMTELDTRLGAGIARDGGRTNA
jgi:5-methylthioribose kinase